MWRQSLWAAKERISISIISVPIKLEWELLHFHKEISIQIELSKIFMELLKLELKILIKINLSKSSQCIRIKNMRNFSKTYFN
jgi:hypothetical protein